MKTNMAEWSQEIIDADDVRNLPVLYFPIAKALGMKVGESVSSPDNLAKVMREVIDRYPETIAAVTGMDLTVDTEAFGGVVEFSDAQAPYIIEHVVTTAEEIAELKVPDVHSGRVDVFTEAVAKAKQIITDRPVFGGMLGPFSLAANLMEVSVAMRMTMSNPEAIEDLVKKSTEFLIARGKEYKAAGADGIFIAEPTPSLLSPKNLDKLSSSYVKQIVDELQDDYFFLILHDCGPVTKSVKSMYATGCKGNHYGNSVDMKDILPQIPADILVFGNVDPSTFFTGTPEDVRAETLQVLEDMKPYPHYVLSSGCDLSPVVPLENVDAYYQAYRDFVSGAAN